jgi:hypothetical protein
MNRLQALHDVEKLTAPDVVNTMPEAGIGLDAITAQLEREGVRSFCESYEQLLGRIEAKAEGKDRGRSDANQVRAAHAGGRRN